MTSGGVAENYMRPRDAAKVLGVSRGRVAQLIQEGRICKTTETAWGYETEPIGKAFGVWMVPKDF